MTHLKALTLLSALILLGPTEALSWRSELYPNDWMLGHTVRGVGLQDYSFAGYKNGEKAFGHEAPTRIFNVVSFGALANNQADSTGAFQRAIDAAKASGGGVVYVPRGRYQLDGLLRVSSSNIIIRGERSMTSELFFTKSRDMVNKAHIFFSPDSYREQQRIQLSQDGVLHQNHIFVDGAHLTKFSPGTDIQIGWKISAPFASEHGMERIWSEQANFNQDRVFFRRTVTEVKLENGKTRVSFKVPLRYPVKTRDEAFVKVVTGLLENCGIEYLKVSNAVDSEDTARDTNNGRELGSSLIDMAKIKDSWIRNVESFKSGFPRSGDRHIQSNGITISSAMRITVDSSRLEWSQNRRNGGNGYLFRIRSSSEVLIQNSYANEGRHNFSLVGNFGNTGHVFKDNYSGISRGVIGPGILVPLPSDFHASLAIGVLVEGGTTVDGWETTNRGHESSDAGRTGAYSIFWGMKGLDRDRRNDPYIKSYQAQGGAIIGTESMKIYSDGWKEGIGRRSSLFPSSLHSDQLRRRLTATPPPTRNPSGEEAGLTPGSPLRNPRVYDQRPVARQRY